MDWRTRELDRKLGTSAKPFLEIAMEQDNRLFTPEPLYWIIKGFISQRLADSLNHQARAPTQRSSTNESSTRACCCGQILGDHLRDLTRKPNRIQTQCIFRLPTSKTTDFSFLCGGRCREASNPLVSCPLPKTVCIKEAEEWSLA